MAAALQSVAAVTPSRFSVHKISSSSFHGDRVACISKVSASSSVARLVIQAGLPGRSQLKSVAQKAVDVVIGENANRHVQRAALAAVNLFVAMPALAEEKGKIFDFNLTLPIIAVQFLLLMVALDNIWFKPVSKVMDSRDENIRSKLVGVRDNSAELKALQSEAESILKAARAETSAQLQAMKKETAAELDEKLQAARERIEKELRTAVANLEEQKESTLKSLDSQVQSLSEEIIGKIIPFKV